MSKFTISLHTADFCNLMYSISRVGPEKFETTDEGKWVPHEAARETTSVRIGFTAVDGKPHQVELQGEAWRKLEDHGLLHKFCELCWLDYERAAKAAALFDAGKPLHRVLVTMHVTMSCAVIVAAGDADEAYENACAEAKVRGAWEINEGNSIQDVYLGGGNDDIEKVDGDDYLDEVLSEARKAKPYGELAPILRTVAESYEDGDLASVLPTVADRSEVGDTLFEFLMRDLSEAEGCDSREEALRRLDVASRQIERVRQAVKETQ